MKGLLETMHVRGLVAALIFLFAASIQSAQAIRLEQDVGIIESTTDGRIVVQGSRGLHVLETAHGCMWCKEGVEVVLTFAGYARATLKPAEDLLEGGPLDVLVVRDGR